MWRSLCSSGLGLSVLPGLYIYFLHQIRELFLHDFFKCFKFLALSFLLPASLWFKCWYVWSCPRVSLAYLCGVFFFSFSFLLAVLIEFFFLPYVPNHWFDSRLYLLQCWFPVNFSLFHLDILHFCMSPFYAIEVPNEFFEHPNNQCFELYIR